MTNQPYTVVVWGDSIAAGGWPEITERQFNVALNTGRPIRVINEGVGGMPAARARGEFAQRVLPHAPDLVIIQFGFNDQRHDGSRGALPLSTPEEFADHLTAMTRQCRDEAGAAVLLVGNHRARSLLTMPSGLSYDETRAQYHAATRQVAQTLGVPFLDMEAELSRMPEARWTDFVTEDGVHLTPLGIRAYAAVMASWISVHGGHGT